DVQVADTVAMQTERDEQVTTDWIDESHSSTAEAILAQAEDVNMNVTDVRGAPLQQVVIADMEKIKQAWANRASESEESE
ncbi:hypothetical protein A2U01_0093851, partial [Trifolium medium]|nr:hypothetical protein [Trifolium medium]